MSLDIDVYINNIYQRLHNHFIDKDIKIYDSDIDSDSNDYYKFYKTLESYILKYKRIIALIILIFLLIIGHNNNYFGLFDNVNNKTKTIKHVGGAASLLSAASGSIGNLSAAAGSIGNASAMANTASGKLGMKDKLLARANETLRKQGEALSGAKDSVKEGAKTVFSPSTYVSGFRDNADWIYRILYSVAIFIVICIVTIPTIAFIFIGIICFFLLKSRIKGLKSL